MVGLICNQWDHLWGYSCSHMLDRFRANKFNCISTPNELSMADYMRHIGPPVNWVPPV